MVRNLELMLLVDGSVEVLRRIVHSSNAAFLVEVSIGDDSAWAVYKPEAGERPLFDFEPGPYRREREAYMLSEHLGWDIVPPTVIRKDPPLEVGSLQWFIDCDGREHYFTLYDHAPETRPALAQLALLEDIAPLAESVPAGITEVLDPTEATALRRRVQRLLREGVLPVDPAGMRFPWPLV